MNRNWSVICRKSRCRWILKTMDFLQRARSSLPAPAYRKTVNSTLKFNITKLSAFILVHTSVFFWFVLFWFLVTFLTSTVRYSLVFSYCIPKRSTSWGGSYVRQWNHSTPTAVLSYSRLSLKVFFRIYRSFLFLYIDLGSLWELFCTVNCC